jgi:hypothetical protein
MEAFYFFYSPFPLFTGVRGETVWKVGGGFLIACVSCFKRARWDIFALFWLLAILQIEAYWDFPDSLWKRNSRKFRIASALYGRLSYVECRRFIAHHT